MTDRPPESLDKPSFNLGMSKHLFKTEHLCLHGIGVFSGTDTCALGKGLKVGDDLGDHGIPCVCYQQMVHNVYVGEERSTLLFQFWLSLPYQLQQRENSGTRRLFHKVLD